MFVLAFFLFVLVHNISDFQFSFVRDIARVPQRSFAVSRPRVDPAVLEQIDKDVQYSLQQEDVDEDEENLEITEEGLNLGEEQNLEAEFGVDDMDEAARKRAARAVPADIDIFVIIQRKGYSFPKPVSEEVHATVLFILFFFPPRYQ
jgi:hypothetical protein